MYNNKLIVSQECQLKPIYATPSLAMAFGTISINLNKNAPTDIQ